MPYKDPERKREYQRKYYEEHRERILEYARENSRKYYMNHRELRGESIKKWREKNPERCRELIYRWRTTHRDEVRKIEHRWNAANKEARKKIARTWRINNPDIVSAQDSIRRARELGAETEKFTWLEIAERDKWTCQSCGTQIWKQLRGFYVPTAPHIDHIVPLSRGGAHTRANSQLLCLRCNCSKGAKTGGVEFLKF